jgi:hypothetical protein
VREDAGVEVHSIDFDHEDLGTFCALLHKMLGWRDVNVWVDGQLLGKQQAYARAQALVHRRASTVMALDQLNADLQRKAAESGVRFRLRWIGHDGKKR